MSVERSTLDVGSSPRAAVFLSYASQDAEAAKRICDALRAAGVEVWFDLSELVGGDQWDAKIRGQIASCALFVPVISAHTQARLEGYFRLEWKLAAQRTHTMADEKAFLLPVLIDGTRDAEAKVPAEFKAVQWTKLPDGEAMRAFAIRVKNLLSGEVLGGAQDRSADPVQDKPQVASGQTRIEDRAARTVTGIRRGWKTYAALAAAIVALAVAVGGWFLVRPRAMHLSAPAVATPAAPLSEAGQKLAQAQSMMAREGYLNRANLEATEEVLQRALTLDSTEADAWALAARVDSYMYRQGYDRSEGRRQLAFNHVGKAISLAPAGWDPRLAKALVLRVAGNTPAMMTEAEEIYRTLLRERPDDPTALREAAYMLKDIGKPGEAARLVERMGDLGSAGWYYAVAGEFSEARRIVDGELAKGRDAGMLKLKIYVDTMGYEDLEAARAASARFTGTELLDDEFLAEALRLAVFRRDSAEILRLLAAFPRETIAASIFQGSKRELTGTAHHLAGREEIARSEWRLALQHAREKSQTAGSEPRWLYKVAVLHAWLGETAEAQEALERARGLQGLAANDDDSFESCLVEIVLGRRDAALGNLERRLLSRNGHAHAVARFYWPFDLLRGDPRFERLLRDHRPTTAKPFDEPTSSHFAKATDDREVKP